MLYRYGIYGLIPLVMTLGFYVSPPVAWVLGWDRKMSVLLIMASYMIAYAVTILLAQGLSGLIFPGGG